MYKSNAGETTPTVRTMNTTDPVTREKGFSVREILKNATELGFLVEGATELRRGRDGVERPFEVHQISCVRKVSDGDGTRSVPAGIRLTIPKNASHVAGCFYRGKSFPVATITACSDNGVIETDCHPGKLMGKKLLMKDSAGGYQEVSIAQNRGGRGIVLISPVEFKTGDTLYQERGSLVLTARVSEKGEALDSIEFQRFETIFEAEGDAPARTKVSHDFLVVSLAGRTTRATTRNKSIAGK